MPKRSEHDLADTAERITAAVDVLAEERGYSGFTVRDVSRESYLSIGTIYDHFENKRDLIHRCIAEGPNSDIHRGVCWGLSPFDPPLLRLNTLLRKHLSIYAGRRGDQECALDVAVWAEYLRDPEAAEPAIADLGLLLVTMHRIVREGQKSGEIERHVFAPAVSEALAAVLLGLAVLRRLGWKFTPRRMGDVLSVFLRGLEPGAGGPWPGEQGPGRS